jgi:hypothetical protein
MIIINGCISSMYNSLTTILGLVCRQYNYGSREVSFFGLTFIILGMIASFVHAGILD